MFGFLGRLLLTKEARAAVDKAQARAAAARGGKGAALASLQSQGGKLVTPERAEMVQAAMQVRAAKKSILGDLSDEKRAKLVSDGVRRLLNEGKD